ncbi:tol-pal system protein YbgF [Marinomonas polaris]|jgi:tol-pal system protein YbgF|uniref:Cell division coordinator CpoB n=1 Tax=Marinomonas polaris DSM 16579 TaxID=1122206 RepID=A0A1M4ZRA8_9GAMM|nr:MULTISPECIES: tol-pal system protein YbgF [Marinomonas]SHF20106.1 tol-pal system protein YbgF [Marinomonas polaris DSM 16579]|tara:strand:- start:25782 stop:26570 length:789 start_codon:yes stop_codon:yes gene_type:complete
MISKVVRIRSFAMALCLTAPFALAESQMASGGLSPNAAADLLFQLETLQQEVQSLRGQLEDQGHELKLMKESQRDRYIDLDKRISLLMSASASEPKYSSAPEPRVEQPATQASVQKINNSTNSLAASPLAPISLQPPTAQAQQAYNDAYNLIRQRNFDEAETAFSEFVKDYPNNSLTGNGYYWLGEVKLVQGKSREAIEAFSTVIQNFPGHNKEQDSLYKLGTVSDQLGDTTKAKSYLQDVIRRFPDSKAAKLAAGYLSKIK